MGRENMKKKAFTLVEIMIALIIVAVVASLSVVTFQKTIDANDDRICRQNLKVLQDAYEIYTIENNALPATLSRLTPEQIHLAYEKVIAKPKENRLAGYFNNLIGIRPAIAQSLGKYYGNDPKVRRCPADKNAPNIVDNPDYTSYSLNSAVFTSTDDLENDSETALLYDTGYYHRKDILSSEIYQIGINPDGEYGTWISSDGGITENPETGGILKGPPIYTGSVSVITAASDCNSIPSKQTCKTTGGCRWKKGSCQVKCKYYTNTPCPTGCIWKASKNYCK